MSGWSVNSQGTMAPSRSRPMMMRALAAFAGLELPDAAEDQLDVGRAGLALRAEGAVAIAMRDVVDRDEGGAVRVRERLADRVVDEIDIHGVVVVQAAGGDLSGERVEHDQVDAGE